MSCAVLPPPSYRIVEEFSAVCKRLGQVIISEMYLPAARKTIRPVQATMGIAGGEKYRVGAWLRASKPGHSHPRDVCVC